jgi:hypothetical protein
MYMDVSDESNYKCILRENQQEKQHHEFFTRHVVPIDMLISASIALRSNSSSRSGCSCFNMYNCFVLFVDSCLLWWGFIYRLGTCVIHHTEYW